MPISVLENAELADLNSFGVAATAARLVSYDDPADVVEALEASGGHGARLVIGSGTNLLFTADFEGTILRVCTTGRRVLDDGPGGVLVEAEAGEPWDAFVRWTLAQGLCGLENLSLIPGSAGASPIQNIGAYGVEMRDTFAGLTAIDLSTGAAREFDPAQCCFDYRDSLFKHPDGRRWLILRVRFRLSREPRLHLDYGELREELARTGCDRPAPTDVARAVTALRRRKLPDPAALGNAGSFFKNPVVSQAQAEAMRERFPGLPVWSSASGAKISAAWMIEHCGWKGVREGDAGVHAAHALVLVNHGHATGAQLLALAMRIRSSVMDAFGVLLEPEPLIA
jgi:UDP-N-acetylmuramate dehydrogenase